MSDASPSAAELADYVDDAGVTVYHSVPTIFRSFLRGARVFPRVRIVRLEGDRAAMLDVELFRRHFAPTVTGHHPAERPSLKND